MGCSRIGFGPFLRIWESPNRIRAILFVGVTHVVAGWTSERLLWQQRTVTYLFLFTPLEETNLSDADTLASTDVASFASFDDILAFCGDFELDSACLVLSIDLAKRSPILALRSDVGMRFIRISIRVRRLCACKAYWARSFRARSVTRRRI